MITVSTAKKLLPLVNNKQNVDRIDAYVTDRVSYLHKQLEQAGSFDEVLKIQGQIKEVRRLNTLKDEAVREAKGN